MQTFRYTARDPKSGQKLKASIQAESKSKATKMLVDQGLAPLEIEVDVTSGGSGFSFGNRIKAKDKILFSRQLSTLINAGLPLIQSLRNVGAHVPNKALKAIIDQIIIDVESGMALSVALAKHPKVFDRVYVSLIAAGETSGTLDKALERIAGQQEKDAEILSKVRGAMVYPIIVLLVMVGVVTFMLVKVLPQVELLYRDIPGASLPFITKILLAVSHAVTKFWWLVIIILFIAGFFGRQWAQTNEGRQVVDRFKMRAWPIGPLFMKVYMARFARTGSTLIASGVPLIQMLEVTSNAIDNVRIEASLKHAIEKVKGGKSLSDALQGDENFIDLVPDMLRIGEESGTIEQMLNKVADYYEKEVDNQVKAISTIIEPVMMIILGIFAFIIVAAILLPIYGLATKTGVR